jgi:hypothetical protein
VSEWRMNVVQAGAHAVLRELSPVGNTSAPIAHPT